MTSQPKHPTKIRGVAKGPSYREIIERDSTPVPDVLAQTANPPQPTHDIPVEHFIGQDFFNLEMERMWSRVWQYACRVDHIPEIGDYYVYDIGRYSVIVVRSAKDTIKAYVNSCLHRGTKLKPSGTAGWSDELMCPFHGWTWSLDGQLQEVPCACEFEHLDYAANALPEVQVSV